jgi:membrane protein DedA with SNARE-associated domain
MTAISLAIATLVSEDLACVAGGLLVAHGQADWLVAILGCYVGILLGDLGLFAMGRWGGHGLAKWSYFRKRFSPQRIEQAATAFQRIGPRAIFAARFLPGARVPMYFGAGMLNLPAQTFLFWTAVACAVWTPLLVGVVAVGGDAVAGPLKKMLGSAWPALISAGLFFLLAVRIVARAVTPIGRAKLVARVSRIWRWEFWPAWLFYLPLLPWVVYLALRNGGLKTISSVNPAIPHGGIVGESKYAILRALPAPWTVPTELIESGMLETRRLQLIEAITRNGLQFPIVLKPDIGERGAGLKLAKSYEDAIEYLRTTTPPVLVQTYHGGPYEAGVFYYRLPDEPHGQILSITDKVFPVITGDGASTVEQLIWRHPRFRMQAGRFLERLNGESRRIPGAGETVPLAIAGNHCQGTEFRDGAHLMTSQLCERIDEIARSFPGFYFGRFDIRYRDPALFRSGLDFQIVELNGATSESTNLYDPRRSLASAYCILFRQWELLFRIGAQNRKRGSMASPRRELARIIFEHIRRPDVNPIAD